MSQTTIRSGREPASYPEYEEILRLFRAGRYGEALPRFSAFLSAHLPELSGRGEAMVRRNIVACRKGLLSPDLAGRTPDGSFPPGWSELVQEVQSYLAALPCADQLAPDPIRAFLGDWLPLVVAYEADPGPLLAELPGRLPERFLPLFFEALQAQFFAETTNYARQGHVRAARALGELYLELTGPGREAPAQASSAAARAAILIRLADLAFFAAPGEPGQAGIEAAALLDRALAEQPGNPFARRLRRHIEEREATIQQIRRFQHDTSSRIGALREALGQLDGAVGELPAGLRSPLGAVRSNLRFITAVNDLVQGRAPSERQYRRIDPAEVCREALAQLGLPLACLELTGLPAAWELVPEYLGLAVENLLRNTLEAHARRRLPLPEQPVRLSIDYGRHTIGLEDRAGGISVELGDVFMAGVTEKGDRMEAGLGLAQARRAIEVQQGTIGLLPQQPPGGAAFVIQLP